MAALLTTYLTRMTHNTRTWGKILYILYHFSGMLAHHAALPDTLANSRGIVFGW